MIPFSKLLKYGNQVSPVTANFLMRAKDGIKDLAMPNRVISNIGPITVSNGQALPLQGSSFNALQTGTKHFDLAPADMQDLNVSKATGDYTIEFFVYVAGIGGNYWYLSNGAGANSGVKIFSSNMYLQNASGGGNLIAAGGIPVGRWVHMALVQSGTDIWWYMDGTRRISATGRWNSVGTALRIGGYETAINGYIDQIRIKNEALYTTATITVPTVPLT